ncbi:MAG: ribose-phosphate pyrophosphokinase [Patescibacteria group bacterium]
MKGMKLFAGNSHLDFARKVAAHLNLPLSEPCKKDSKGKQITWLSNQNVLVDIKENVRDYHCFVIQTQSQSRSLIAKCKNGQDVFGQELGVNDQLMELFFLINALVTSGAKVTAVLPYMPYIRSDKKDHPRVCIGAKLIAEILTLAGASGVLLMDPHFAQIHGYFDEKQTKVDVLKSKPIMGRYLKENYDLGNGQFVVVAPDANEAKHAGPMATNLKLKMAIIDKRRYSDNEEAKPENLMGEEYVRGRRAIIFDDEIGTGGTLIESAEFLIEKGAVSVIEVPTHGVFSSMQKLIKMQESPIIEKIIVANTVPVDKDKLLACPKIVVVDVSAYFAKAIDIIYKGKSLDAFKRSLYGRVLNVVE